MPDRDKAGWVAYRGGGQVGVKWSEPGGVHHGRSAQDSSDTPELFARAVEYAAELNRRGVRPEEFAV